MRAYGCDVGCGFGTVSLLTDEGVDPVVLLPKSLPGGMPTSAFARRGGEIRVWNTERERHRHPAQTIHAVKKRLPEGTITLSDGRGSFSVEADAAYTAVARDLFALVEKELRAGKRELVRDVVLTYPAGFADFPVEEGQPSLLARMERCLKAVQMGGGPLRVVGMLPEPGAVALDYLYFMQYQVEESRRLKSDHFTVLVYDLGHGTFDTALVTARSVGEPYQLLEKSGLPDVGGQDFDRVLQNEILRQLRETYQWQPSGEVQTEEVRGLAVAAKHALTDNESYTGQLFPAGECMEFTVTRADFEKLSAHLLQETLLCAKSMLNWAEAQNVAVDHIVLSGGGSRMPMVKRALEGLTEGKIPVELYRPELAVSYGAARYAAGIVGEEEREPSCDAEAEHVEQHPNTVLEQLTSKGYGLRLPSQRLEGEVRILIPAGVRLPYTSQSIRLRTGSGGLTLRVVCTRGEGCTGDSAAVEDCRELIRLSFTLSPDTEFQCTLHMDEKVGITAICTLPDGTAQSRGTHSSAGG